MVADLNIPAAGHPAFDHRDHGTAESEWAASTVLRSAPSLDLSGVRRLVVLAAHPDDESLGAGGLLSTATRRGISTVVLIATMGERSHPDSATHSAADLAALRRAEVFDALGILAPTAIVRMLGLPDGDLLSRVDELSSAVRPFVEDSTTLVVTPWVEDGHPDHAAAACAAAGAVAGTDAELFGYPIWAWHWGKPETLPDGVARLDLNASDLEAKRAALQCHRSQIQPLSPLPGDEAIVPPAVAVHFERPYEIFLRPPATATEDPRSLGRDFFDDFYRGEPDPWGFESRWYETRKRALTMASLPRERFSNVFEPGCSIGVLTAELAGRSDRLLATDISDRPLSAARRRLAGSPGVRFEQRRIPADWPGELFDLIVLSEVGYYCGPADLRSVARRAGASLTADGVLLACHWRHPVADYPRSGDDVHRVLAAESGLEVMMEHVEEDFLLQLFCRPPAISVARATGLIS